MSGKYAKFYSSISNMHKKVIEAKEGQRIKRLSEPVDVNNNIVNEKQTKRQEKV